MPKQNQFHNLVFDSFSGFLHPFIPQKVKKVTDF